MNPRIVAGVWAVMRRFAVLRRLVTALDNPHFAGTGRRPVVTLMPIAPTESPQRS
jgi:hypothetical protein